MASSTTSTSTIIEDPIRLRYQQQAEEWKSKGNEAFAKGAYEEAVAAYAQGVVACDHILSNTNNSTNIALASLKGTLLSNRAMCHLKLCSNNNDNTTADVAHLTASIDDCTTALDKIQPAIQDATLRCKLLFRRAKAHFLLASSSFKASGENIDDDKKEKHLQEAAKDVLVLLQLDPSSKDGNQLLQTIRAVKSKSGSVLAASSSSSSTTTTTKATTPTARTLQALKKAIQDEPRQVLHHLKILLGLLDNDVVNTAMELGRLDAVPVLLQLSQTSMKPSSNMDVKVPVLAMQIVSISASYPAFVRQFLVGSNDHQGTLRDLVQTMSRADSPDIEPQQQQQQQISVDDSIAAHVMVSAMATYVRILLHADRDDPKQDIQGTTCIDSAILLQTCNSALMGCLQHDKIVIRAVLDVLSTWTAGTERDVHIRASLIATNDGSTNNIRDPTLPTPKSQTEIRAMTPHELADYRKRQTDQKIRDQAWAFERAITFCHFDSGGMTAVLRVAIACQDHALRREITVVLGRILAALDNDDQIKTQVQPYLGEASTVGAASSSSSSGVIIEEVHEDDEEEEKRPDVAVVPLEAKMEHAVITAALLLSKKEVGSWALNFGWVDSVNELPDLIESGDRRAMCLASEVVSGAATIETARNRVIALVSAGLMEKLILSDDRDIRSAAASAVAKLGLASKSTEESEMIEMLQGASDLLEDDADEGKEKRKDATSKLRHFSSFATSSVERAIEMINYLVANTAVKDELAAGFQARPESTRTALENLVRAADLPNAGESLSGFGLATIFHHLAVTNEQLRKEMFEGKEVTMEQYDEMQRMQKTQEEKDQMDAEKDTDTQAACDERIRKMASVNVPHALVQLTEGASEHTVEQVVLALSRMAGEQSVRGLLIQQGVLTACIKVEKNEGPTETDTMKKVIRTARHTIAKILVTTNPSLLTSAQRLGSIRPLIKLIRDTKASDFQHFEALLAVTNIAGSGEDAQNRIVSESGIGAFHFAMFSDHEMVRRASTEAMCNLVPHPKMMDHLAQTEHLKLWLAFASDYEEHYECARAATGCLAMATQDPSVATLLVQLENFRPQLSSILESGRLEIMHRGFALLFNLVLQEGPVRDKVISEGFVEFCEAYLSSYHSKETTELEFSPEERDLLPVTVDVAKRIVNVVEEGS